VLAAAPGGQPTVGTISAETPWPGASTAALHVRCGDGDDGSLLAALPPTQPCQRCRISVSSNDRAWGRRRRPPRYRHRYRCHYRSRRKCTRPRRLPLPAVDKCHQDGGAGVAFDGRRTLESLSSAGDGLAGRIRAKRRYRHRQHASWRPPRSGARHGTRRVIEGETVAATVALSTRASLGGGLNGSGTPWRRPAQRGRSSGGSCVLLLRGQRGSRPPHRPALDLGGGPPRLYGSQSPFAVLSATRRPAVCVDQREIYKTENERLAPTRVFSRPHVATGRPKAPLLATAAA